MVIETEMLPNQWISSTLSLLHKKFQSGYIKLSPYKPNGQRLQTILVSDHQNTKYNYSGVSMKQTSWIQKHILNGRPPTCTDKTNRKKKLKLNFVVFARTSYCKHYIQRQGIH